MEALLPSEIARLVFGYLEDEKCKVAAESFFKESPHLQECRIVHSSGRQFNKRVNGCTLIDILDKFSAALTFVQKRLSKLADCDQLRNCGDLVEQLRFLVDGSRVQRFAVSIKVTSQANSQTYGGSPVITSSIRRRYHSVSDRSKRNSKTLNDLFDKNSEPVSSQVSCDTVEATPLESLPGHTDSNSGYQSKSVERPENEGGYCTSTKSDYTDCMPLGGSCVFEKEMRRHSATSQAGNDHENSSDKLVRYSPILSHDKESSSDKCVEEDGNDCAILRAKTTATSTDELTTYTSIEVQTVPYPASESESADETIENLSLLTKELLNRTELHEKIAENINKAILPMDVPVKDDSLADYMGGELNTSIMAELDNAVKSIVAATETDPIFEDFLNEIIGSNIETDTSPDEDHEAKLPIEPATNTGIHEELSNTAAVDMELEGETVVARTSPTGTTEVPLKQRLRSSSRQQSHKPEDEGVDRQKDNEKIESSLADHNAAAILSIINANITTQETQNTEKNIVNENTSAKVDPIVSLPIISYSDNESSRSASAIAVNQIVDSTKLVDDTYALDSKTAGKSVNKKSKSSKLKPEPEVNNEELITEQEMMAMPTLIVCSKEEISNFISVKPIYTTIQATPARESRFIPIAPKGTAIPEPIIAPLCLKTVHVPVKIPRPIVKKPEISDNEPGPPPKVSRENKKRLASKKSKTIKPTAAATQDANHTVTTSVSDTTHTLMESITLYTNENSFGTMVDGGHMPAINLDDTITLTGIGLSPYLKFHNNKSLDLPDCQQIDGDTAIQEPVQEPIKVVEPPIESESQSQAENILMSRRTPRSILKSRSKNNRLSLSTPRRRNSHIRALDFSTPLKSSKSEHKLSCEKLQFSPKSSKRGRSICRTSLFKSPPFSSSLNTSWRKKSPAKDCRLYKVPIATRSPAPKLVGGWDKYTGVGMILGEASPYPSSSTEISDQEKPPTPVKPPTAVKKSWDADLRKALQGHQEPTSSTSVKNESSKPKSGNKNSNAVNKDTLKSKSTAGSDASKRRKAGKQSESIKKNESVQKTDGKNTEAIDKKIVTKKEDILFVAENLNCEIQTSAPRDQVAERTNDTAKPSNSSKTNAPKTIVVEKTCENKKVNHDAKDSEGAMKSNSNIDSRKTVEKPTVKKYAQLKTLNTKVSRNVERKNDKMMSSYSGECSQKKVEELKISPENLSRSHTPHPPRIIDLETPRKLENSTGVPPTPRFLSPSSSTITPFTLISEEMTKVGRFVSTPEFPPTPGIGMTPKIGGENTADAIKNGEYITCSPYYEPSTEQGTVLEKFLSCEEKPKGNISDVAAQTTSIDVECQKVKTTGNDFISSNTTSKLEITQFEVIKENLPKEEAVKELKLTGNPTGVSPGIENRPKNEETMTITIAKPHDSSNDSFDPDKSSSSSDDETSDTSSSDTSSSSSSSSSCSSDDTKSLSFNSSTKSKNVSENSEKALAKACDDNVPKISPSTTSHVPAAEAVTTDVSVLLDTALPIPKGDESPLKVFPLIKTQEEDDASMKETPAKDEALLSEANISETPSSSKTGIETLTNLNLKISAFNSPEDHAASKKNSNLPKPKITNIQHVLPNVLVALKPPLVSDSIVNQPQPLGNLNIPDIKAELELRRKQLAASFRSKPQSRQQRKFMPQRAMTEQVTADQPQTKNDSDKRHPVKLSTHQQKQSSNQIRPRNTRPPGLASIKNKLSMIIRNKKIPLEPKSVSRTSHKTKVSRSNVASTKLPTKDITRKDIIERRNLGDATKGNDADRPESRNIMESKVHRIESNPSAERLDDKSMLKSRVFTDKDVIPTHANKPIVEKIVKEPGKPGGCHVPKRVSSHSEDEERGKKRVVMHVRKNLSASTSKVEQIKRDLFSDEEPNDQRTTRSKSRQLSDVQKHDTPPPDHPEKSFQPSDVQKPDTSLPDQPAATSDARSDLVIEKPKEELTNVLECLQLVPAAKNDSGERANTSRNSSATNVGEYHIIYDDSAPVKKRKRKFSNNDLEYTVEVTSSEDYQTSNKTLTATKYEELLHISPKPKKKTTVKKIAVQKIKPPKVDAAKPTASNMMIINDDFMKPLATSSPTATTLESKVNKSTIKVVQKTVKPTMKNHKTKTKGGNKDLLKRKMSDSNEEQPEEKKRCITDPQLLLNKLDLDSFLTSVHGPF